MVKQAGLVLVVRHWVVPGLLVFLVGFPFVVVPLLEKQQESNPLEALPVRRRATSQLQILQQLELQQARDFVRTNSSTTSSTSSSTTSHGHTKSSRFDRKRQRPNTKIVYLLHVHKSGGTTLCNVARHNLLSATRTNCNVQGDQRCCGYGDSLEAQQIYYQSSKYDFVASEGRMYQAMDLEHYSYIVVLRNSQQRYFSHWKHARRQYLQLPSFRHQEELPLIAAGGAPLPLQAMQEQQLPLGDFLERESKAQRTARREAKLREIQAWTQNKNNNKNQNNRKLLAFTNHHHRPHKWGRLHTSDEDHALHHDILLPGARLMPHPAEDPNLDLRHNFTTPLVGDRFAHWWTKQPDNWNFRQLCGTHCIAIPKYQLTLQDWQYTLQRLLQFDTILFLEDLQASIHVLAHRMHWNVSDLNAIQLDEDNDQAHRLIRKEATRQKRQNNGDTSTPQEMKQWYQQQVQAQLEQKERHKHDDPIPDGQIQDWDPLMSALDDALYDIAQRFEQYKIQTGKTTEQLTHQELQPFQDMDNLSTPDLQSNFQLYMEEAPDNHRTLCQNECCAVQCSAW
jgi:hypothetical protein